MLATQERPGVLSRVADWLGERSAGFWAIVIFLVGCLIYLPRLGAYPLWDPWEPHYTQVAWEMQERLTWNNPWYRGLDNWWSKPILMLWMLRASLAVFWDTSTTQGWINGELAARLPFALMAIAGGVLHFDWVRRLYGQAAGVLAGIVLLTAPQYLVIGRQVMADTPFIVTYAAGIGYLAVGLFAPRDAPRRPTRLWPILGGIAGVAFLLAGLVLALFADSLQQIAIVVLLVFLAAAAFGAALYAEVIAAEPTPEAVEAGLATAGQPAGTRRDRRRVARLTVYVLLGLGVGFAGWAPLIVATILFAIHWAATFRWRDTWTPRSRGAWLTLIARRGALTTGIVGVLTLIGWLASESPRLRMVAVDIGLLTIIFGVFWDFPHARHTWRTLRAAGAHWGVPLAVLVAAIPISISALGFDSGTWEPGWQRYVPAGILADFFLARGLWSVVPFVPLILDAKGVRSLFAWLRREYAFVLFWVLMALSVLAKAFIAPVCALMILAAYWLATFRWRDYAYLTENRAWLRYLLVRCAIAFAIAGAALAIAWYVPGLRREQRALYQGLIATAAAISIGLGVFFDLPPMRHALRMLARMRAGYGLILFFAIAAPWFVYMTVEHGWPFWNEFIFYHHIGRAAGTIDKPGGTFEYFVKHVGFGLFPWTAFALGAVWTFCGRSSATRSIADRRNLFILLAAALPYLFFSLSGTKFAHYIFPVIPMLGVMLAVVLVWLGPRGEERVPLAEEAPSLGPPVEAHPSNHERPWWDRLGARGDLVVFVAVALILFAVLAHDLVLDFRHFLRLFLYYRNRPTPAGYYPIVELQVILFPIGILIGTLLLFGWVTRWHRGLLAAGAVILACYISWITMPAMEWTYSFKPFVSAYEALKKPGEPIGQFNDWQQPVRSVIFLFRNRCVHLRTDKQAEAFLKRQGRKFILVDNSRLADLRRVAKKAGVKLYVVFDGHPYGRIVSDQPNEKDTRRAAEHILAELPSDARRMDADFEGKIRMIGWKLDPLRVQPGESTTVSFFYRCQTVMDRDWQIFVHGDGPSGGSRRIHRDHFPVEGIYLTTEWQEGEIIRDRFRIDVPGDYPYEWFTLWTGWYIGNQRLALRNNPPNDGQNRVRGPRVQVIKN